MPENDEEQQICAASLFHSQSSPTLGQIRCTIVAERHPGFCSLSAFVPRSEFSARLQLALAGHFDDIIMKHEAPVRRSLTTGAFSRSSARDACILKLRDQKPCPATKKILETTTELSHRQVEVIF